MGVEFIELFTQMGWVSGVLMSAGIILCLIEMIVPGFGFFGITGGISVVASIIARGSEGASLNQIIMMILIVIGVLLLSLIGVTILAKVGLLGGLVNNSSSIPTNYVKSSKEMNQLTGRQALALTEMKPIGKIKIENKMYEAISIEGVIPMNTRLIVVSGESNIIKVKRYAGEGSKR